MSPPVHTFAHVRDLVAHKHCVAAVLDPLIHAPLLRQVGIGMMDQIILSSGSAAGATKTSLPRMVHLHEGDDPSSILLDAAEEGDGLFLVARTGCDFADMADAASHLCHVLTSDGSMAWLRWYEPYIFRTLFPTLDGHQLAHWYDGAIHSFLVADKAHDQTVVAEYARPEHTRERNTPYLQIKPDQAELLEQAHFQFYVDELTRFVRDKYEDLRGEDYAASRAKVASYVQAAEDCGFSTMNYLTEFVKLVLDTRETCLHPQVSGPLSHLPQASQEDRMACWLAYCRQKKLLSSKDRR